jgi:hypothetical protein
MGDLEWGPSRTTFNTANDFIRMAIPAGIPVDRPQPIFTVNLHMQRLEHAVSEVYYDAETLPLAPLREMCLRGPGSSAVQVPPLVTQPVHLRPLDVGKAKAVT